MKTSIDIVKSFHDAPGRADVEARSRLRVLLWSRVPIKFHGARRLTLTAWPTLQARGGSVVLTSGTSAEAPKAAFAAVGAINVGIAALAKAFSERGVKEGVQVNSVLPGPVMTGRRRICIGLAGQRINRSLSRCGALASPFVTSRRRFGSTGHR